MTPGSALRPLRFSFASFAVKGFDLVHVTTHKS